MTVAGETLRPFFSHARLFLGARGGILAVIRQEGSEDAQTGRHAAA